MELNVLNFKNYSTKTSEDKKRDKEAPIIWSQKGLESTERELTYRARDSESIFLPTKEAIPLPIHIQKCQRMYQCFGKF